MYTNVDRIFEILGPIHYLYIIDVHINGMKLKGFIANCTKKLSGLKLVKLEKRRKLPHYKGPIVNRECPSLNGGSL